MMRFYSLEKLINLHDGYRKLFKIDQHRLMLMQIAQELYLVESHCPHLGHPLLEADIIGGDLRCPLHGYQFDLHTGNPTSINDAPCRALKSYEIVYQQREVGLIF